MQWGYTSSLIIFGNREVIPKFRGLVLTHREWYCPENRNGRTERSELMNTNDFISE